MNAGFFQGLMQIAAGTTQAVSSKKGRGKRGGKPACTPCAAQAYVDGLRPPAQKH